MITSDTKKAKAAAEAATKALEELVRLVRKAGAQAMQDGEYARARWFAEEAPRVQSCLDGLEERWKQLGTAAPKQTKRSRLAKGRRTPESEFRVPILRTLADMGGEGRVADVLDRVGAMMGSKLNDVDRQSLPSKPNVERWRNTAQFARNDMVNEGLLDKDAPFGTWRITDKGRGSLPRNKA